MYNCKTYFLTSKHDFNQLCCMHLIAELTCYDNHNLLIDVFHFRVWVERRTEKTRLKCLLPDYGLHTKLALRPGPFNQLSCTLVLSEGGIGIFGFAVLVFIAVHRLSVLKHLGFGIRLKALLGFWIWYPIGFFYFSYLGHSCTTIMMLNSCELDHLKFW